MLVAPAQSGNRPALKSGQQLQHSDLLTKEIDPYLGEAVYFFLFWLIATVILTTKPSNVTINIPN